MAYCPHCAYSKPVVDLKSRTNCPNCGRTSVIFQLSRPTVYSELSASEAKDKESPAKTIADAAVITICGLFFIGIGFVMKGPLGMIWDLLGVVSTVVGVYLIREVYRNKMHNRKPAKGFIDHLKDLEESKKSIETKISELRKLIARQEGQTSERAENRKTLLSAALENRYLKLQLLEETRFIIEAKRRINHLAALAQNLQSGRRVREVEKEIDKAFEEMKKLVKLSPDNFRSRAGKKVRRSLERSLQLHAEISEQIEDRLVMRALSDEEESTEIVAMEQIHDFLEHNEIDDDASELDMEETIEADEQYQKINAQLRLLREGIKNNLAEETFIDIEPDDDVDLSRN